jgi:hypothetical protein
MFCEDKEQQNLVAYLCDLYPDTEEHIVDLQVWCYFNRRDEYLALLEKHSGFDKNNDEHFIDFSTIDYNLLRDKKEIIEL